MKAWLDHPADWSDVDDYGYPADGPTRADIEAHAQEQQEAHQRRLRNRPTTTSTKES